MEFDKYSSTYHEHVKKSLSGTGADRGVILEVKAERFVQLVQTQINYKQMGYNSAEELPILDIGCGIGLYDEYWKKSFRNIVGVDQSAESVKTAANTNPECKYIHYSDKHIPLEDASMAAVVAVCVVHHVPPAQWQEFFNECARVLKSGGIFAVFEHNPLNPVTRRAVANCEFDQDAVLIKPNQVKEFATQAGLQPIESNYILFFPWKGKVFRAVENKLNWLPLGGQYYSAFKKP